MNTIYTHRLTMIRRALSVGALCLVATLGTVHANSVEIPSARPVVDGISFDTDDVKVSSSSHRVSQDVITPNDWTYTALQTLIKHGAITDTHGFVFDGSTSYTKDELMPLIDEVVEKREQMNENDRQFALRIYQENMREVMDYRIARDKKITVERRQKLEEKRARKSGKTKISAAQQEALDIANDEVAKPEERALTDEQIKEKMKKFKIDDSRVKVKNDVRIRYTGSKDNKSKSDARMQTEITFKL